MLSFSANGVLVQINFAHADIVTLGAFAAYGVTHLLSGNYFAGIAAALRWEPPSAG